MGIPNRLWSNRLFGLVLEQSLAAPVRPDQTATVVWQSWADSRMGRCFVKRHQNKLNLFNWSGPEWWTWSVLQRSGHPRLGWPLPGLAITMDAVPGYSPMDALFVPPLGQPVSGHLITTWKYIALIRFRTCFTLARSFLSKKGCSWVTIQRLWKVPRSLLPPIFSVGVPNPVASLSYKFALLREYNHIQSKRYPSFWIKPSPYPAVPLFCWS